MCGITGVINFNGIIPNDIKYINKFNNLISHRGPDAEGIWNDAYVVLGHRRLSIIDLSDNSNQPMISSGGDIAIVFNGEIYNYEKIKSELMNEFVFQTDHSDTEVIINAYKKWGIQALHKFTGMFAIVLYDRKLQKVFLIRDRLGKKPLFFTIVNNSLYFSSENHVFFEAGLLKKEFDHEAIYDYLTFLTVPAPKTFFKNVQKVEAGYYYEITKNKLSKQKYWDIAHFINKKSQDKFEEAYTKTEDLLTKAMAHRNVADVPISIALSGGLDSSLNLYFTKQNRKDRISTINISYEETSVFDESIVAKRYSENQDVEFIPKRISQNDFINWVDEYLKISKDMPTGDPNTALMYGISKIARENGFKVLLVGEGGDELGGYPIYNKLVKLDRYLSCMPKSFHKFLLNIPLPARIKERVDRLIDSPFYARRFIFGFTENEKKTFWKKENSYNSFKVLKELSDEIKDDFKDSLLRKTLNIEYKLRLAELLLPRVDYPSMVASIEARSPFMDHKLIEYTATLNWNVKMKNGPKSIIKKIAQNKLPDYIINAPKVGFGMLLHPFLRKTMPIWFKNEILDKESPIHEYISYSFLKDIYSKHKKSKNYGYKLWILYSLNKWMEKNIE